MALRFAACLVLVGLIAKCAQTAPPMDDAVHSHPSKHMPLPNTFSVQRLPTSPEKSCEPGEHDDYDEEKEVTTCQGFSQESDCQMVLEADGCRRCQCPRACPSIYCGLRCRRVLRSGACPYCDCRRGKQVYVLGKKP
ncbi:uncharacterized protein LOC119458155 [Dermacentor silvarum]|uniref:uncharacterized protein LOC119458155 n=1 Tax=Dermacentor silvarum TaxID=543639 RepID=UPI0018987811|nr:uncharacterized protein LOC119458155 [Dermacentor silvarum]